MSQKMLGKIDFNQREATVIGAGISGLLIADTLDRLGFSVTLYEQNTRAGGLIETKHTEYGISEAAAHSFLVTPPVLKLCERLGVSLEPVKKDSKARYILRRGMLRRFPLSLGETIRTFFRAYFVPASRGQSKETFTLEAYAKKFLGQAALDYLITPMVKGIYGAKPSELLVNYAFPKLWLPPGQSLLSQLLHRKFHARPGPGKSLGMMAPRGGMGELVSKLESDLQVRLGDRFKRGQKIETLPIVPNLVLAITASDAAKMLEVVDFDLSRALSKVEYAPLISVTTFVDKKSLPNSIRGVGVLMPTLEQRKVLGILFNSSSFSDRVKDEEHYVSLTTMVGGSENPQALELSDAEIKDLVNEELRLLFGKDLKAVSSLIYRWPRAVPKYDQRLIESWRVAERGFCASPGKILFGNYTGQVSIRGLIETCDELFTLNK